jgi:hypothetical protein
VSREQRIRSVLVHGLDIRARELLSARDRFRRAHADTADPADLETADAALAEAAAVLDRAGARLRSIVPEGDPELLREHPGANYLSLDPDQRGDESDG